MELLDQIEGYLTRSGTKASMFGRQAVGDPRFVQDMREGRRPRRKTTQRVLNFLLMLGLPPGRGQIPAPPARRISRAAGAERSR